MTTPQASASAPAPAPVRELPANWWRRDLLLAAAVICLGLVFSSLYRVAGMTGTTEFGIRIPPEISVLVLCGSLIFYRRYPVVVAIWVTVGSLIFSVFGMELFTYTICLYLSFYGIGAWESRRKLARWARIGVLIPNALIVLVITGAMVFLGLLPREFVAEMVESSNLTVSADAVVAASLGFAGINLVINALFFGLAWYFGNASWKHAISNQQLHTAHENLRTAHAQLRATQDELAHQAVHQERLHIARELHDVIAHQVAVMNIHAAAARRLLEKADPGNTADETAVPAAIDHIRRVEDSSQQAVTELRDLVYTLRDQSGAEDRSSLPGLAQLPELLEAHRTSTGMTISYRCEPAELPVTRLSPAVQLTFYRVIQEALTNAYKHAGPWAAVTVELELVTANASDQPDQLRVTVTDNGYRADQPSSIGAPTAGNTGTGTGLRGLEERLTAIGGTFHAGPLSPTGWQVTAAAPIPPATASSTDQSNTQETTQS